MSAKVAILGTGTLFADGIISRLQRSYTSTSIEVIEMNGPDPLVKMISDPLDCVVLVHQDPVFVASLQSELYSLFPRLKIIIIEPHSDQARVVQWAEYPAYEVGDILTIISDLSKHDETYAPENPNGRSSFTVQ